jgi:hypothetical protein
MCTAVWCGDDWWRMCTAVWCGDDWWRMCRLLLCGVVTTGGECVLLSSVFC